MKDAIKQRILNLCDIHDITINKLAIESGLTQSTLSSIINTGSNNPTLATVAKICAGLKISVRDFFDDDLFDRIDPKIE